MSRTESLTDELISSGEKFATESNQDETNQLLSGIAGFVPSVYDYIIITYRTSGNGTGEIDTVTFKTGGSGGTTVATLTLAYDASNRLSTVTKT